MPPRRPDLAYLALGLALWAMVAVGLNLSPLPPPRVTCPGLTQVALQSPAP